MSFFRWIYNAIIFLISVLVAIFILPIAVIVISVIQHYTEIDGAIYSTEYAIHDWLRKK